MAFVRALFALSNAVFAADIAGTVTAINVTAGNTTSAATPVAVLQPEGKGYTLLTADCVSSLASTSISTLVAIYRLPKGLDLVTFDVTGSVTAGQTLNLSVGQKSANFDLIVPNSAIRECNGKDQKQQKGYSSAYSKYYFLHFSPHFHRN